MYCEVGMEKVVVLIEDHDRYILIRIGVLDTVVPDTKLNHP